MRQYIRYYFQKRIFNSTDTKKANLKKILSPLLVEYDEKSRTTTDVASAMSALAEDTIQFASGIECGMGDNAEGFSAQEFSDLFTFYC